MSVVILACFKINKNIQIKKYICIHMKDEHWNFKKQHTFPFQMTELKLIVQ